MSNRLRNQELTGRPRVIVDGGEYTVQWIGRISEQACEYTFPDFVDAVGLANSLAIAKRYAK